MQSIMGASPFLYYYYWGAAKRTRPNPCASLLHTVSTTNYAKPQNVEKLARLLFEKRGGALETLYDALILFSVTQTKKARPQGKVAFKNTKKHASMGMRRGHSVYYLF